MSAENLNLTSSELKHRAIQEAGTEVFLRLGYEAANMELIASAAGVSKQTIYNHFHSKERLFQTIIEELVADAIEPVSMRRETVEIRVTLADLAWQYLSVMLRPHALALHRLLVAEASRFPDLAARVYEAGPARVTAVLGQFLEEETARGHLAVTEPQLAAEQFFGMLTGYLQIRALFNLTPLPGPAELKRRIDGAVQSFMAIHAPVTEGKIPLRSGT